jgi:hypothetical protein
MKLDTEAHIAMAKALGHPVANKEKVKALVEEWRKAFEFAVNHPDDGKQFGYIDAFMALPNLARLVIEDLETRCGFTETEEKRAFRELLINTIARSLLSRLED